MNSGNTPQQGVTISMLLVCLSASLISVNADPAVPAWVQRYNSSVGSDDQAYHAAADVAGNVVVAGYRNNGFTWNDLVVIKYANSGTPLWTNVYGGPENFASELNALALDSDGNVFLGGFSRIGGSIDYLLLKYSHAGVPLWTNYYDGAAHGTDRIWDLAVDSAGDVIVTGASLESAVNTDSVTIKYSGAGIPLWTNRYSNDSGNTLVVDSIGNVIVGGYSAMIKYTSSGVPLWTNDSSFSFPANRIIVNGNDDILSVGGVRSPVYGEPFTFSIIKYSTAGTILWTNQFKGPDYQLPRLALHPSGKILATTSATNASGGYDFFLTAISDAGAILWSTPCEGIGAITSRADGQIFTAGGIGHVTTAYSGDGLPLWTNRFFGSMGSGGFAVALVLAGNDQVVTAGATYNAKSYYDFTTIAYSGNGTALWTNWHDGGVANYSDVAQALAVGADGSVVVTGSSQRLVGEGHDYTTIRYAATGQPLWTNWFSGPASSADRPTAIAMDGAGDVIVTGQTISTNIASSARFATTKISSMGIPLWTNFYGSSVVSHVPQAVAVDGENNAYVTGYSHGGSSYYDFATIKYSAAGLPQWTNRYNTTLNNSDDRPAGMVVDGSGTIYVTGYGPSTLGGTDFITLAYSNTGAALWTNRYHLAGADNRAVDVVADAIGNVFVTGYSKLSGQTTYDFATIKYSSAGVALWTNRYNGPANSEDRAVALAADQDGNVFVTGYSTNSGTGFDFATIKYSGTGAAVWTNRFDGPGHSEDRPAAVVVDAVGNVTVTGFARSGSTLPTSDFVTIKYSNSGTLLWTATYNGTANDYDSPMSKACLGVSPDGSVYVTGESDGSFATTRIYDFVTIKYVEVSPVQLTVLPHSSGFFAFSFTNKPNAPFSVLTTTNVEAVSTEWTVLGGVTETTPGHFNFTDTQPTTNLHRFYRVRSP